MDDSWAIPFNPDEIFILENDIEILTDPILGLLLLGQENADEVDVETFLDFERFLLGDNPADNTHEDVFQDFVFEVNPQNGQTVTAGGLEEDGFGQEQRAKAGLYEEAERSVSQTETKLDKLSTTPTSSSAECLPTAIKAVVPAAETPRGRPKKAAKSALDLKIDKLLNLHKSIRQGRRRKLSLPGDGRRNGMMLSAIQRLLSLKTDQGKIPREASELVAAGVAEKDVGAIEVMLSLPESNLNSKISFPANLASLTGLRGLLLSLEGISQSVEVKKENGIAETEVNCLGDPVEDQKLLFVLDKCFGSWARPYFDIEAPVDEKKRMDQEGKNRF